MKNFTFCPLRSVFLAPLLSLFFSVQVFGQIASQYSYTQSNGIFAPITGGSVLGSGATLDDSTYSITAASLSGFSFNFAGTFYTAFTVSSNGFMGFGSSLMGQTVYTPLSSTSGGNVFASPMAADLGGVDASSKIGWSLTGTAPNRVLTIEWINMKRYAQTSNLSFQVKLFETTNLLQFVYGPTTYSSAVANTFQVGIKSSTITTLGYEGYKNRSTTTNWNSTIAGTTNTASCTLLNTVTPPVSGLIMEWAAPLCFGTPTSLSSSSVTATTANIAWVAASPAPASGYEFYVSTSATAPTAAAIPTGTTAAGVTTSALSSLTAGTQYYFWIRSNCNGTDKSAWAGSGTFTTACAPVAAPTTLQNFSTYTGAAPNPVCWREANGPLGGSVAGTVSDWILKTNGFANASSANPGSSINLFGGSTATPDNDWMISNEINLGSVPGAYRLKFKMAVTSYNGTAAQTTLGTHTVKIVVSTDGGATWSNANVIKTYTGTGVYSNTGQDETILLNYTGNIKIGFLATTTTTTPDIDFHIDDFIIESAPTDAVDFANIQSPGISTTTPGTSVEIFGQAYEPGVTEAGGPAAGLAVWYSTNATDVDPSSAAWTGTWNPATFNVQVGNNDEWKASITPIAGQADTYYSFRYQLNGGPMKYGGYSATGGGFWDATNNKNGKLSVNYEVYTTAFPPNNTVNNTLDIYLKDYNGTYDFYTDNQTSIWMYAGVRTSTQNWQYIGTSNPVQDLNSTATLVEFVRTATTPNVYKATLKFADYFCIPAGTTVTGIDLLFRNQFWDINDYGGDNNNKTKDLFLDLTDAAVAVNAPTIAPATGITLNSATLNWTAPASGAIKGYEYYFSTSNVAPNAATSPSGTTGAGITAATVSGLSSSTTFYYWVRTKSCDGASAWSARGNFTTLCGPVGTFPYSENFDGVTAPALPNCWTFADVNNDSTRWKTSATNANSAPNALYYNYNTSNAANDWAFSPGISMTAGTTYQVSFSYRTSGSSFMEKLKVSYGSSNTAVGMTNLIHDFGTFANTNYQAVSYTVTPSSSGVYYIGFHAYSAADMFGIHVDNFSITELAACSGTPVGGTTVLTPNTGAPNSVFNAVVTGSTSASGLSYQWEQASSAAGPWTDIAGATAASATLTAISTEGTMYYRRKTTCAGASDWSNAVSYTTAVNYCAAGIDNLSEPAITYIDMVSFRGALNQAVIDNPSTYSTAPRGYQNHSGMTPRPVQAQGNGLNVYYHNANYMSYAKAWVDWNRDGDFDDAGENVYSSGNTAQFSSTFGIVIPLTAVPGDYRLRIRINDYDFGDPAFGPCGIIDNWGETEDYLFTVIANCSAIVTSTADGFHCGPGTVAVSAVATGSPTEFRWYDAPTGGNLVGTSAAGNWITPSISATTTYYAAAFNGCESLVRIPVRAVIKPLPTVTFTPDTAVACGETSVIALSATGSAQVDHLIDENFEGGGLGVFSNQYIRSNGAAVDLKSSWTNRTSTFVPAEQVWFPAISSGVNGNRFLSATSDLGEDAGGNAYVIDNALVSPSVSTISYTNLTFKFRMYYSRYGTTPAGDYVNVETSTDGGATWTVVKNIISSIGYGTAFAEVMLSPAELAAYENKSDLRFRIRYHAVWGDGLAVDDIEFFGERPLAPSFTWNSSSPISVYADAAGTVLYNPGDTASQVYIKPTLAEQEAAASWNLTATATLNNGCTTVGSISIANNNSFYNSATYTNWSDAAGWKPSGVVPNDLTKCVIVRTPVSVQPGDAYSAKNVVVMPGGVLNINGPSSLTLQDELENKAGIGDVVIGSGASLVQHNDLAVNKGNVTVKRNASVPSTQYSYWGSPVEFIAGQNFKTIYPNIPTALYYNEGTAYFGVSSGAYIVGRGLALKGPSSGSANVTANFLGKPYNGIAEFTLSYSGAQYGFNLVGNPYPSNIDLSLLYSSNSTKIEPTFQFWDHTNNTEWTQMGTGYGGDSYAKYNAGSGTPTPAANNTKEPNGFASVGQGFMVRALPAIATAADKKLVFSNSIRKPDQATFFNRAISAGKFWLRMTTPKNNFSTIAITYTEGAVNAYDIFDSRQNSSSDMFYSVADGQKLAIQGRALPFANTDIVPLGSRQFEAGTHVIALVKTEGIFSGSQPVYLKDQLTGTVTKLSEGAYTFTANAGETTGRFEIIYQPETILGTDGSAKDELKVYRDGQEFVINSSTKKITGVEVYDTSGKMILKSSTNQSEVRLDGSHWINGVYVLKIHRNGEIMTKKVVK